MSFSWQVICLTSPLGQAHWHFPEEEKDFLLIQEVIRVARSLRAQCGLTKEKPVSKSTHLNQHVKEKKRLYFLTIIVDEMWILMCCDAWKKTD